MECLLGPPELCGVTIHEPEGPTTEEDAFLDAMVAYFNSTNIRSMPEIGFTENMSATFLSSGNSCLDFFFHVVPNTPASELQQHLELAWNQDPLTTLKLICNLRGVRGTGKSDKESYYSAALWLHEYHPKTFACNVESFADFGYYKDLLEVLFRLLEGADVRKTAKSNRRMKGKKLYIRKVIKRKRKIKPTLPKEERIKAALERCKAEQESARVSRKEKRLELAKKVIERYRNDTAFRFLHDQISDLFAKHLKSDLQMITSGKVRQVSLAAKWCPSIDSSYDQHVLICESIARKIFPKSLSEYEGLEYPTYAYRVRDRLRKDVLVPLRKVLKLPEVYMSANKWGDLPYNRVASVAMKTYKKHFTKHDKERFDKYLEDVKSGKAKIAAGALLPHEIISSLNDNDDGQVAELQWKRMVDDVAKLGKIRNCISVCDVSGSMKGTPMKVCIALGILVSELSEEPWKGKVITFSQNPNLHLIEGKDLKSKVSFVKLMDWGMNTNFQRVFDKILEVALINKLSHEDMIKRIFVFSDMEFDQASINPWETDYEVIKRKYKESGYENAVPEIIFWNLRNSRATPVPSTQKGVALVSGFSQNLLKLFLESGGVLDPEAAMKAAISGKKYDKLVVLD